jgi:hypothetical protein
VGLYFDFSSHFAPLNSRIVFWLLDFFLLTLGCFRGDDICAPSLVNVNFWHL